jgi:CheY-like chemotaxis protein
MPYGKVLVVDDVETNLYVAKGLLAPYKLNVETAISGFSTIELINDGNNYDIIFMDHMMPGMDGMETTRKIRELGYKGVIVALTANALVGNDTMFKQHGFDDFISKPIDLYQLNSCLNSYIRDRHPDETGKYQPETARIQPAAIQSKLLEVFRRDAEKAIVTLRRTSLQAMAVNNDIKLFTTTVHAMKSALVNVGENEISDLAFALEKAGLNGDKDYIADNVKTFIEKLEALISKLSPTEAATATDADTSVAEDTAYLLEQLQVVKTACEDYDRRTAFTSLDLLNEKQWKAETQTALDSIRELILLHSDFDGAVERVQIIIQSFLSIQR